MSKNTPLLLGALQLVLQLTIVNGFPVLVSHQGNDIHESVEGVLLECASKPGIYAGGAPDLCGTGMSVEQAISIAVYVVLL
jgi:hypothetical protein